MNNSGNSADGKKAEGSSSGLSPRACIALAVFSSCFGATFVFGYCISVLNSPRQKIECFFLRTWLSSFTLKNSSIDRGAFLDNCIKEEQLSDRLSSRDDNRLRWMYTMTQVVWVVFAAVGGFMTSLISERFGRRTGLVMANVFSVLAAISIAPTLAANLPIFVYITRALPDHPMTSMYVTEIVPIRLRGAIGSSGQLSITIGIFVGGLVGLEQALNREKYWVVAIALSGLPSLHCAAAPAESPRFLYLNKGDEAAAKQAVQRFCAPAEVDEAMLALRSEKVKMEQQEAAEKFSIGTLFTSKRYRMALLITLVLCGAAAQRHQCGIMLENTGVQKSTVPLVTLGVYALNVLSTIVALPILEKFGRRLLLLLSLAIVLVSLVALLIVSQFTPKSFSTATATQKALSGVACALVFIYVVGFAIGLGCITVMYISEIFQQKARGAANSVAMGVLQTSNALVVLTYYTLEKSLGHFVYLIYIVPVTAGLVFLFFFMPETKNRSTDDIADE
uniref:MFS domain-containing protein n=1 Tax=Macrostomum lignano TaxID=282301 RepID=A0A1I8FJS8_9PLAT